MYALAIKHGLKTLVEIPLAVDGKDEQGALKWEGTMDQLLMVERVLNAHHPLRAHVFQVGDSEDEPHVLTEGDYVQVTSLNGKLPKGTVCRVVFVQANTLSVEVKALSAEFPASVWLPVGAVTYLRDPQDAE